MKAESFEKLLFSGGEGGGGGKGDTLMGYLVSV